MTLTAKARLLAVGLTAASAAFITPAPAHANSAAVDYFRTRADRTAVPSLLSQDERQYYRDLFAAIERKDWTRVQTLFAQKTDGPLHQEALAEYYTAAGSPRTSADDLNAWLAKGVSLPQAEQEGMETVIGLIAVFFVTGMIVWMRQHARHLKRELEAAASSALASGTTTALAVMAFLAVLREGFETAVFLLATFQNAGSARAAVVGAVLGVLVAIAAVLLAGTIGHLPMEAAVVLGALLLGARFYSIGGS